MAAIVGKMYRIVDNGVRAGESPSDIVMFECKGTLSSGTLSCTTPFKLNSQLGYIVCAKASTDASGVFTADITKPATSDAVVVYVFGHGTDLQNAFS